MHAAYLAVRGRRREQFLAALDFLDTVLDPPLKRVVLPLLDSSEGLAERGRDLFGLEIRDAESAMRDLIHSSDPWLSACAMAAAAGAGESGKCCEAAPEWRVLITSAMLALRA